MKLWKLVNLIDFRFLLINVQSKESFGYKIWEFLNKVKTDVDIQFLGWMIKKA